MHILHNVSLKLHSTMRLGGNAAFLATVHNKEDLLEALKWAEEQKVPAMMIGSGSNIVWQDSGYEGIVIVNKLFGFHIERQSESSLLTIGAGENWDSVVERATHAGLSGIEALSMIPGTAGATPVQNVGAYGQEIADTLVELEAYDVREKAFVKIPGTSCKFGYRTSRFKTTDRGRFFITSITLRLSHTKLQPPFYRALQQFFDKHGLDDPSPQMVRDAVMVIRSSKLPDPKEVANNGSFFANPIIETKQCEKLLETYPDMPHWPVENGEKLSAAWLLEQAGFKDYHDKATGMGTWPHQPLVLVNEHAQKTAQLLAFRQKILDTIEQKFSIKLEQEPELLP